MSQGRELPETDAFARGETVPAGVYGRAEKQRLGEPRRARRSASTSQAAEREAACAPAPGTRHAGHGIHS